MAKNKYNSLAWLLEEELPPVTANNLDALPTPDSTTQVPDVSLDQIIDRYLIQYESEASPQPSLLERFLFEADEEPPADDAAAPADDAGADPAADASVGGSDADAAGGDPTAPDGQKAPTPQMNMAMFGAGVARLIKNFESLVNPQLVVLQRAYLYVAKNYSETAAKEMAIDLERRFGLSVKSMQRKEEEKPQAPFAYNSIPGGASAGGGGA